ncbi:hypothetical protein POSPLADRAFT_1039485 [Postia placenta MAD-698-R-SB12]|uniref:Tse2 ADP-ribosyltransferase toxin domain-containing protein n=1 Tax=Postia placenta MAD-698-R-SB12 TaxID=670580 RepID=A0A1X6N4C0_9APHY|nr:hypothetical protein POSPLADRAFT_1039485 [Postia placenta MAD-698-R-SB12]OSX63292.1 hypothetical protein POSPLADRAFT_1039485 [Postia placenta MAD-698-R-SB12]
MHAYSYILFLGLAACQSVLAAPFGYSDYDSLFARADRPELYRSGNAGGPKFDNIRPNDIKPVDGKYMPGTGGISTFSNLGPLKGQKHIWALPASADLGPHLKAVNDHDKHWSIQPSTEITEDEYKSALTALNSKVQKYVPPKRRQYSDLEAREYMDYLFARASRPDLYRGGNAGGPQFDKVRDSDVTLQDGKLKPGFGGVSTSASLSSLKNQKHIYKLPASASVPSSLKVFNDHGSHWLIEPASEMTIDQFKSELASLNSKVEKVALPKKSRRAIYDDFEAREYLAARDWDMY